MDASTANDTLKLKVKIWSSQENGEADESVQEPPPKRQLAAEESAPLCKVDIDVNTTKTWILLVIFKPS